MAQVAPARRLLPMDGRGRLTLGRHIRKNGIEPAGRYALSFGPDQTVILTPITSTTNQEASNA